MQFTIHAIERALHQSGKEVSGGQEYIFECPFCGKEDHMYVNPEKGKFHCFRCNEGGGLVRLMRKVGVEVQEDEPVTGLTTEGLRERLAGIGADTRPEAVKAGVPDDFWPIAPDTPPETYLFGRGLTREDIDFYRIGVGMDEHIGRVIVPAFDEDGECVIWVARDYTNEQTLRYKTPKGISRAHFVPFLPIARKQGDRVIICEGVFSAIAAGRDAVATLGKGFSKLQVEQLAKADFKEYFIAYDGDALDQAMQIAHSLFSLGKQTFFVPIPMGEDPDSVGRENFQQLLTQSLPFNEESALRFRFNQLI